MLKKPKKTKSYGTSTKWGVRQDIDVPIVKTEKPVITVINPKGKEKKP